MRSLQIMALNGMFDEMDARRRAAAGGDRRAAGRRRDRLVVRRRLGGAAAHGVAGRSGRCRCISSRPASISPRRCAYVETLKQHLGLTNVRWLRPDPKDIARFDPQRRPVGDRSGFLLPYPQDRAARAEIAQYGGWVTGRKRYQTAERGVLPHFELTSDDRIKVNPLAYFADADVNAYKIEHGLPEHPLFAKGYKSIGCAPVHDDRCRGRRPARRPLARAQQERVRHPFRLQRSDRQAGGRGGKEPVQGRRVHRRSVPRLGRGRRPGDACATRIFR